MEVLCGRGSTSLTSQQQSCQMVPSSSRCRSSGLSLDVPEILCLSYIQRIRNRSPDFSVEREARHKFFAEYKSRIRIIRPWKDVIDRSALEQAREGLGGRDIEEPLIGLEVQKEHS